MKTSNDSTKETLDHLEGLITLEVGPDIRWTLIIETEDRKSSAIMTSKGIGGRQNVMGILITTLMMMQEGDGEDIS
jgi:hypothetical protein